MQYNRNDDFDNFGFGKSTGFNSSDDGYFDSLGGYDPTAGSGYNSSTGQSGNGFSSDYTENDFFTQQNDYQQQESFSEHEGLGNNISNDYSGDNNSVVSNTLTYSETKHLEKEQGYSFTSENNKNDSKYYGFVVTEEMYKENRNKNIIAIVVFSFFFLVFAVLLISASVKSLQEQSDDIAFRENSFKVYGTVTKIEVIKTDKRFSYRAMVTCNAPDGSVVVPNKSFSVNTSVKEGNLIPLLMSKNDIYDVRSESELNTNNGTIIVVATIFSGVAFISILVGLIIHFVRFSKDRYNSNYYKKERSRYVRNRKYEVYNGQSNGQSIWTMQFGGSSASSGSTYRSSGSDQFGSSTYKSSGSDQFGGSSYQSSSSVTEKKRKKKEKEATVKGYVIGMIIGLVWLIGFSIPFGILLSQKIDYDSFMDRAVTIQAKITHITVKKHTSTSHNKKGPRTTSTSYNYYATVEYQRDNTLYRRGEFKVDASTDVGDWMTVYIDPDNPGDCRVDTPALSTTNIFILGFLGSFGILLILFNLIGAVKAHNKKLRE